MVNTDPASSLAKEIQTTKSKKEKKSKDKNKSKKKYTQKIAFKIQIITALVLLVLFTVLIEILARSIGHDNTNTYTTFSTQLAQKQASALSYWLRSYYKDLRVFTKNEIFQEGDIQADVDFMLENPQLISTDFDYVGVSDMSGLLYDSTEAMRSSAGGESDYFTRIMTAGESECIDNPEKSYSTGNYEFHAAVQLTDSNGILYGLFMGAISIDFLQNEIERFAEDSTGTTFILDGTGRIIAHPDQEMLMKNPYKLGDESFGYAGLHDLIDDMLMGNSANGVIKNIKTGEQEYLFYTPIDGTPWTLAISVPKSEVYASAVKSRMTITIFAVGIALLVLCIINFALNFFLNPLEKLNNAITEIASGDADLTKEIQINTKDEIGDVVRGFNKFTGNLRSIIREVKTSKDSLNSVDGDLQSTTQETASSIHQIASNISNVADRVSAQSQSVKETAQAVNKIAQNINALNDMIEDQSSGVTQASAAVEQMLGNITSVSKNTEFMAESFNQLKSHTQTGVLKQSDVNRRIKKIGEQSQTLLEANKTISHIASQTNLLAMNAAIEAAHAGTAGAGFSVVADEIRKLSENSSAQSKKIAGEIKNIQESIEDVVNSSSLAQESLSAVMDQVTGTGQLVQQIRGAMEESVTGSRQITDALKMMNDGTVSVRTSSANMTQENKAILEEVERLQTATDAIHSSIKEMSSGTQLIENNGKTLANISSSMRESIKKIGSQIDLFKI